MNLKYFFTAIVFLFLIELNPVNAQPLPPDDHEQQNDTEAGGGAPIGSGVEILTLLAAGWGARKWYLIKKEKKEATQIV